MNPYWKPLALAFRVCVFIVLSAAYLFWTNTTALGAFGGDNAWYLLTAQDFSPFSSATQTSAYYANNTPYPMVVPLILAWTGGAESLPIAHAVTTLFLIGSLGLLYYFVATETKSHGLALITSLSFAALPFTYFHALEILSENYYLFFSLLAMVLAAKIQREVTPQAAITLSIVILAVYFTRSAGLSMVVAYFLFAWFYYPSRTRLYTYISVTSLIILGKLLRTQETASRGYMDMLNDELSGLSFSSLTHHYVAHAANYLDGWFHILGARSINGKAFVLLLSLIAIFGLFQRVKKRKIDAFYTLAYILLMLLWPFSQEAQRYIYPILPLLMFYMAFGISVLDIRPAFRTLSAFTAIAAFLIAHFPTYQHTVQRFTVSAASQFDAYRHTESWYRGSVQNAMFQSLVTDALIKTFEATRSIVSPDDCTYSIKPSIIGFYSKRISKQTPLESLPNHDFAAELKSKGCRYVVTLPFRSITYKQALYPEKRIADSSSQLFSTSLGNTKLASFYKLD